MSSISFPHSGDADLIASSSLRDSMQAQFYSPPGFDVDSSFQMNPLSAHPPRTPRPSTATQSHFANTTAGLYDEMSENQETEKGVADDNADEDEEVDEEGERVVEAETKVGRHEVWRDMLVTSDGRDKAFVRIAYFFASAAVLTHFGRQKLVQYSIRVYLLLHTKLPFRNSKVAWPQELARKLESARGSFSFTRYYALKDALQVLSSLVIRKMLILFNWLTPLSTIMAQKAVPYSSSGSSSTPHSLTDVPAKKPLPSFTGDLLSHPFLQALLAAPPPVLLDLVNGLSDDISTLSRLGLVGPKTGARAARFADWCWLFGTLVGLVENGVEMGIVEGLQHEGNCRVRGRNVC